MRQESDPFEVMARSLEALAAGARAVDAQHDGNPAVLSPAHLEETAGTLLKDEWDTNPATAARHLATLLMESSTDHLLSMALLLRSTTNGIFATYTVSRGLLEASVRAWDLLEPGIDTRERVRRHMNERLYSLNESRFLLKGIGESADHQNKQEQKIKRSALRHTFAFHQGNGLKASYLGDRRKSAMTLAGVCLAGLSGDRVLGQAVQRLLSAQAHSTPYALMQLVGPPADLPERAMPDGVSLRQICDLDR